MKLWILSDLHLEHQTIDPFDIPNADVAVLAGDIHRPVTRSIRWLSEHIGQHMPVIFVPGNHEFYHRGITTSIADGFKETIKFPSVHLLHDTPVIIDGVRFIGATLWTDYALDADPNPGRRRDIDIAAAMEEASLFLADHYMITLKNEWWTPTMARAQHLESRAFIEHELAQPFDGPTVVVTHHGPHPLSVGPRFIGSSLNPAFVSDLSDVIEKGRPDLWVHGHVHHTTDYRVGDTRIVCNPHGYGWENPDFDRAMVIEVKR